MRSPRRVHCPLAVEDYAGPAPGGYLSDLGALPPERHLHGFPSAGVDASNGRRLAGLASARHPRPA